MAIAFLVLFTLAFVVFVGWQDRESLQGGAAPKKALAVTIFAMVLLAFIAIVMPRV